MDSRTETAGQTGVITSADLLFTSYDTTNYSLSTTFTLIELSTPGQQHTMSLESQVSVDSRTEKHQKNSRDLDLSPMTLKLIEVLEVVDVHVRAKCHRAKSSGS